MQCKIITSATSTGLETAINTWLDENMNSGSEITIEYVVMSEGSIGSAALKVVIFYNSNFERST